MPSGIKGFNAYLDEVGDGTGWTKLNGELLPDPTYNFTGLQSGTDYSNRIAFSAVDNAGLESPRSAPQNPLLNPLKTLAVGVPVEDPPLPAADRNAIDAIVAADMALTKTPGISISITGPRGSYAKSYGLAVKGGRALTLDDHARIGSTTKLFTALAVLREIDKGTLSLDDTLEQYVPGVAKGDKITVRHLLSMRSGVVFDQSNSQMKMALVLTPSATWGTASSLAFIKSGASTFEPGTQFAYTNSNYILLDFVLRAVTGRSARDIIMADIIPALGLSETYFPLDSDPSIKAPFSRGYWTNPLAASIPIIGPLLFGNPDITSVTPGFECASGAVTSTVGDLTKFAKALRDGLLLTPEMSAARYDLANYAAPGSAIPVEWGPAAPAVVGYGLGMFSFGTWFGHDGSVPGFEAQCMFETNTGATFSAVANFQTPGLNVASSISTKIASYLYPGSMTAPDYANPPTVPTAARLVIQGGTPDRTGTDGIVTPAPARLRLMGGIPGLVEIIPQPALLTVVGGIPDRTTTTGMVVPPSAALQVVGGTPDGVVRRAFEPVTWENTNQVAGTAIPAGATQLELILLGKGGIGALGDSIGKDRTTPGGPGGGGAARITVTIDVADLGPTCSMTLGTGPGVPTTFISGDVSLSAGSGSNGSSGSAFAGAPGGVATVIGVDDALTGNGGAGGYPNSKGGKPSTNGGGGGGNGGSAQTHPGVSGAGGKGGISTDTFGIAHDGAPGTRGNGGNTTGDGGDGGGGGGFYEVTGRAGSPAYMVARWT